MALTVFTAADQAVGPLTIAISGQEVSVSVQGDLSRGSIVTLERAISAEATYRTMLTFNTGNTPYEGDFKAKRGWKWRIRCSTFVASDAPSAELF